MAPTTSRDLQHNKPWGNYNPGLVQERESPKSMLNNMVKPNNLNLNSSRLNPILCYRAQLPPIYINIQSPKLTILMIGPVPVQSTLTIFSLLSPCTFHSLSVCVLMSKLSWAVIMTFVDLGFCFIAGQKQVGFLVLTESDFHLLTLSSLCSITVKRNGPGEC